jgi:hypothetical protein
LEDLNRSTSETSELGKEKKFQRGEERLAAPDGLRCDWENLKVPRVELMSYKKWNKCGSLKSGRKRKA